MRRRWLLAVPLVIAGGAGVAFLDMLRGMTDGTFDPRSVGHPLLGKPIPAFDLGGFTDADLRAVGKPVLLNFFASWCQPCQVEAPVLDSLGRSGAPLFGIAYKDQPAATSAYLRSNGDPYRHVAADSSGLVAINFGVTGVPETFLIDPAGIVRWHFAGPLSESVVASDITPRLRVA
jgi:cytochrome c biogenesis protein CcmG/thiol:disulfide interchange protein DsbE